MENNELIKMLEDEIKAKKLMLRAVKDDAKARNKKLFTETKFGKACLQSLVTLSKPFHKMHERASQHLQSPVMAHFGSLIDEAEELLKEASETRPGDGGAPSVANECARLILEIGAFNDKHSLPAFCEVNKHILQLKEQMTRLRPPVEPGRFDVVSQQLEATAPQA